VALAVFAAGVRCSAFALAIESGRERPLAGIVARRAYPTYGGGRHPAALNFGEKACRASLQFEERDLLRMNELSECGARTPACGVGTHADAAFGAKTGAAARATLSQ
jgi:hypothetical protein